MAGAMWMAGLTARMWELMAELLFRRQMADLMVQELAFELVDLRLDSLSSLSARMWVHESVIALVDL